MKNTNAKLLLVMSIFSFLSCNSTYYDKQNNEWIWVARGEMMTKSPQKIYDVNNETFEVLKPKTFAKDKNAVYFEGRKIEGADPVTFKPINEKYSEDSKKVFFQTDYIIGAKPEGFEIIKFPYARDKNDVYNICVPLKLNSDEIQEFKVTNTDKLMADMISSTIIEEFIKQYPNYSWLNTLEIRGTTYNEYATGETKSRKFKGFEEVK